VRLLKRRLNLVNLLQPPARARPYPAPMYPRDLRYNRRRSSPRSKEGDPRLALASNSHIHEREWVNLTQSGLCPTSRRFTTSSERNVCFTHVAAFAF
jgi:hypothetical protein